MVPACSSRGLQKIAAIGPATLLPHLQISPDHRPLGQGNCDTAPTTGACSSGFADILCYVNDRQRRYCAIEGNTPPAAQHRPSPVPPAIRIRVSGSVPPTHPAVTAALSLPAKSRPGVLIRVERSQIQKLKRAQENQVSDTLRPAKPRHKQSMHDKAYREMGDKSAALARFALDF